MDRERPRTDYVRPKIGVVEAIGVEIAGDLETRVASNIWQRARIRLEKGKFEKQIDILRTGLDDIDSVLKSGHRTSDYQASALSHSHGQMPVPAPAPQTAIFIAPQPHPITFVFNNGQAPGCYNGQPVSQAAAVAYPAPARIGYQAAAPIGYPALAPSGYPTRAPNGYPPGSI